MTVFQGDIFSRYRDPRMFQIESFEQSISRPWIIAVLRSQDWDCVYLTA